MDWPFSSTPVHVAGRSTPYVDVAPAQARIGDLATYLSAQEADLDTRWSVVLKGEVIGRPVGAPDWVRRTG